MSELAMDDKDRDFNCAVCDQKTPHGHTIEEMADAMARQGIADLEDEDDDLENE